MKWIDLTEELAFDFGNLSENLSTHAEKISYVAMLSESSNATYEEAKNEYDYLRAKRWEDIKKTYLDNNKPLSDGRVDNLVDGDDELHTLLSKVTNLKAKAKTYTAMLKLFEQKTLLMQTFSANLRKAEF